MLDEVMSWASPPETLDTKEKIESYAKKLYSQLSNAVKAAGSIPSQGSCRSAPWWTLACKKNFSQYQKAVAEEE